jgi:ATP-dependent Clp protease protease subunit
MEQAVRNHPSNVIVHVDGYAASAATYLALAGDEIEIADGGFFMIHNSWSIAMGNAEEFRQTAGLLDQIDATIVATYAKRTNLAEAEIRDMLAAETWIGAQDAVKYGFADRVSTAGAKDQLNWNVSALLPANAKRPTVVPPKQETPDPALAESRARAERMLNHVARIAA